MRFWTVARYAFCAALLAGAIPAPASAQFGNLRKKLKEKIVNAAIDRVADKALGADTSTASSASRMLGSSQRARKSAPAGGPVFDDYTLEITPDLLEGLQRALAAEQAERKALAAQPRKVLPRGEYNSCKQQVIMQTPEGQLAFAEYRKALQSGSQEAAQKAGREMTKRLDDLARPRCGPDPIEAMELRRQDELAISIAGVRAFGLGERQYAILRERIVPFCAAARAAEQHAQSMGLAEYVFLKSEIDALRPLCGKLMPLLQDVT